MTLRTRTGAVTALGSVAALVLAACASTSPGTTGSTSTETATRGGTLNMLGTGDIDYMDPNISYYSIGYLGLRMWSRQLFTYPAAKGMVTTAVPDLASEIPTQGSGMSADGKTYTITLRKGAKWNTSPARQVTAQDVVRGVKRTCNPAQPFGGLPDYVDLIQGMKSFCDGFAKVKPEAGAIAAYINGTDLPGVKATGDLTVQFTLTHPASFFVDMLTLPAFSPAPKEWDAYVPASADLAQHTLSDGPYQIDSYTPTKSINFSRNPAWDGSTDPVRKAWVDKIVVNETNTQDSIQQQLQTGTASADMEFDAGPPPSQLPALISAKDSKLNLGDTASTNPYVVFNTASPNNGGVMKQAAFRQALSYGMNRTNMIQVLGGPQINQPLSRVLPPTILGGEKGFDLYPFDSAKAQSMLKTAASANITLKVLYRNKSEGSSKVFQTIQQDLSKIGVNVVGVPSPNADFYTKYLQVPTVARRGVWDLAIAGWGADWYGNAALSFFNPLFSGAASFPPVGSNFGLYESSATNALIQQAISAPTKDQAQALWEKADRQVMADAAFFPITSPKNPNYRAEQVHDAVYVPAIQNFDPTNVWLSAGKQGG